MISYEDLPRAPETDIGSAWGIFGQDDEVGTINYLNAERVRHAAGLVKKGTVFNLDYPLDAFSPGLGARTTPTHRVFRRNEDHRDDYLDGFYLQGSSQIDGLRHFRFPGAGFYNGLDDALIEPGTPTLGINRWAERGIVGRGLLIDVMRHRLETGQATDDAWVVEIADLEGALQAQGEQVSPGDIILLRTGWTTKVLDGIQRGTYNPAEVHNSPGLRQSEDMVAWLWNQQISMIAADNLAVEVIPVLDDSPFVLPDEDVENRSFHTGMMHRVLIPLLGVALGELWNLDALAMDCAQDGVWEFLLVAKPLNLVGGVGSPANAVAVK